MPNETSNISYVVTTPQDYNSYVESLMFNTLSSKSKKTKEETTVLDPEHYSCASHSTFLNHFYAPRTTKDKNGHLFAIMVKEDEQVDTIVEGYLWEPNGSTIVRTFTESFGLEALDKYKTNIRRRLTIFSNVNEVSKELAAYCQETKTPLLNLRTKPNSTPITISNPLEDDQDFTWMLMSACPLNTNFYKICSSNGRRPVFFKKTWRENPKPVKPDFSDYTKIFRSIHSVSTGRIRFQIPDYGFSTLVSRKYPFYSGLVQLESHTGRVYFHSQLEPDLRMSMFNILNYTCGM